VKIAVVEDYGDVFRRSAVSRRLEGHEVSIHTEPETDLERLAAKLRDAEIVVLTQQRTRFPRALIEKLPKLRFISQTGRNTGHLDLRACAERGIAVSAIGGGQPHATAELTWGLAIAALRHIPYESQRLREGYWQSTVGVRLYGRTLGIYACGRIGTLVALVGAAFGMRVVCWGREGSLGRARADGYEAAASREQFFAESDVVSLRRCRRAGLFLRGSPSSRAIAAPRTSPRATIRHSPRSRAGGCPVSSARRSARATR
jgi:D-3-phosphoglycerate dehydrogenase / 2-oxoglutarate reductase